MADTSGSCACCRVTFFPPSGQSTPRQSPRHIARSRLLLQRRQEKSTVPAAVHLTPLSQRGPQAAGSRTLSATCGAVSTPVWCALQRRVATTVFEPLVAQVQSSYSCLEAAVHSAEANGILLKYLLVTRKLKIDDELLGPVDALRLVVDGKSGCKCFVYDTLISSLSSFGECTPVLERMNDPSQTVCPGIKNYSAYKASIGYDLKRAKPCSWPSDTVWDIDCCVWYRKCETKKSNLCVKCVGLKWQLDARSKTHQAISPTTKRKCQEASSNYPFAYLSPASKKAKVENLKKALATAQTAAAGVIERVPVNDVQNDDISDFVQSIHSSEEGQRKCLREFLQGLMRREKDVERQQNKYGRRM